MPINKFTTLLDLSRQAKIITGETATFDGKILAGIPFSGYPTGVNTATTVSLGVVSTENAVFSGNTGTTVFDVSNPLSPYYNPLFSGYTATTWTNPLFSATTSGLTLPITILSADTQVVGPFWTLTQTGYTGDYIIGTEYTGYSVTYSFFTVTQFSAGVFSGITSASQQNFSAGTLDYKGPLDYLSSKENISVDGRLITNKITITNGASSATTNYVLSQIDDTGKGGWNSVSSLLSGSCLPIVNLETINDCSSGITFNSDVIINGDVIVNGSATTINTEIIRSKDNNIILNYSGTHLTAIGGGFTLEDGVSNGVNSRIYSDSNGVWLFDPSLSASSGTIINFSADTIGSSGDCVNDLYVSNIHSCSPLNINPLNEGNVYFGSTSGVTIDVTNSRVGIGTKTPTERLTVSGTSFFKTSSLTTGTSPSFYYLDGVSTPTDTTTIKSIYKEFRPTTTSSSNVVGDGTLLYPNITSPTNGEFYSKANLLLYTDNLSLLNSIEALTSEINVVQIQTNTGTYNDIVKSSSSVLRNLTAGGTINKYVGFWMNGFDFTLTHNGTTNNMYGFYMDDQSTRSGNIPPTSNRWGIYIDDDAKNYFAGSVGIGTINPSEKLHISSGDMLVENTNGKYYTDIQNTTGPLTILSGNSSGVSRIGVIVPTFDSVTLGVRGPSAGFPGYGKQGDAFIYSSGPNNGFNLISAPGTGTDDYIRFYAGSIATSTPDLHIQGSGVTRGYVGINTSNPQYLLDVVNTNSRLFYDPTSVGGRLSISGKTNVPRFGVEIPAYLTKPQASTSLGIRAWDDLLYPDYGNPGDVHLYAGVNAYGLNIISEYGATSADYIRFYAGQDASSGNTPDIHIQGSGVTRGYVGIGTDSPNYPLQILGGTDTFYYDPFSSLGGVIAISGDSNVPRISVQTYNSPTVSNIVLGIRSITDTANPQYGKTGDTFLYASQSVNGLNIANAGGIGTEDYIRFYAGKTAISTNTPAIHIQGSGTTKGYVGINTSNPQYLLDVVNTNSRLYYDPTSAGGSLSISGKTNLPRFTSIVPPYLTKPLALGSMGIRAWNDTIYNGYGKVGDMHIYASNSANGLNIINQGPGTNTEDYIRFYAGRDALFNPDIHIQGSGVTRGYVGIGTSSPSEKLDVNGKTKTTTLQVTSGATNGYVLTSDASGNASWQASTGATSGVTFWSASTGVDAIVVKNSGSVASGLLSLAQGYQTTASGATSHAEGFQTIASGDYSHSEGYFNISSGIASHAEGGAFFGKLGLQSFPTSATTYSSHAEGAGTLASGIGSHSEGFLTISSGNASHAEGYSTQSSAENSHAEGINTLSSGVGSHSEGQNTISSGGGSHAEGLSTSATTTYAHAEGGNTLASGGFSHAEGSGTVASGTSSHAEGYFTNAIGDYSHSEGYTNIASGVGSHAEGGAYFGKSGLQAIPTSATTYSSHAEGVGTLASGIASHAEGVNTISSGVGSHAEGNQTTASGDYSHAEGNFTLASGDLSHAEGNFTLASATGSHAEGNATSATTQYSHAEGYITTASGDYSHSEGYSNIASGIASHAEGGAFFGKLGLQSFPTSATTYSSHAEGTGTLASATGSHAEGNATTASGSYSHAEGKSTLASGNGSHSEGVFTISSGESSHAEGYQTSATTFYSHAEGRFTLASGLSSHSEGFQTSATTINSHAEGDNTLASGNGSHAEGVSTSATTVGSHAEGQGTIAYENYQHVSGRWNNTTNANQYFIIGRGTSNASRSNAFRVDSAGNVYGAGATYNSGADYAEYFESLSGDSIPYGTVVELLDDKIKVCVDSNNAMGVISSNPTLIGNNEGGTADEWVGKYEKDEWGKYIMEDYSYDVIDYMTESGETIYKTITEQTPKLSQNFDPNLQYIPRSQRSEWNVVGLVGQVRVLKNQQIPSRWIKMKDINNDIALYLIR